MDDEGVYVCEVHNHFGKIQAEARITVTGLSKCDIDKILSLRMFLFFFHPLTHK